MSTDQWTAIESPDERRSAALETTDHYAPLRAFFWEAPDERYPEILRAARNGVGTGFDGAGVTFPDDLDETEQGELAADQVEVYDPMADLVLDRSEFLRALAAVARTALEVRRRRGLADPEWVEDMTTELTLLEDQLDVPPNAR